MHAARFIVVHRVLNPPRPRNLTRAMRRRHAKLAPETFSPFPPPPPPFLQPGKIDRTFDLSHLSSPRFSLIVDSSGNLHLDFSFPAIYRDFFFNGNFSLDSMVLPIFLFHEIFFRSTIQRLCLLDNFFFE